MCAVLAERPHRPRADSLPHVRRTVPREQVLQVMKRVGLDEQVDAARAELPEVVDLDRDDLALQRYGLGVDQLVDRLGGSPW
jgi:hypothetical protein